MNFDVNEFRGLTGGDTLTYRGRFVARFKHMPRNRAGFVRFLVRNFQVEEYFAAIDNGHAPVTILESKGYVPAHIQAWLAEGKLTKWNPRRVDITTLSNDDVFDWRR